MFNNSTDTIFTFTTDTFPCTKSLSFLKHFYVAYLRTDRPQQSQEFWGGEGSSREAAPGWNGQRIFRERGKVGIEPWVGFTKQDVLSLTSEIVRLTESTDWENGTVQELTWLASGLLLSPSLCPPCFSQHISLIFYLHTCVQWGRWLPCCMQYSYVEGSQKETVFQPSSTTSLENLW